LKFTKVFIIFYFQNYPKQRYFLNNRKYAELRTQVPLFQCVIFNQLHSRNKSISNYIEEVNRLPKRIRTRLSTEAIIT